MNSRKSIGYVMFFVFCILPSIYVCEAKERLEIKEVKFNKNSFRPGDTLEYEITFNPQSTVDKTAVRIITDDGEFAILATSLKNFYTGQSTVKGQLTIPQTARTNQAFLEIEGKSNGGASYEARSGKDFSALDISGFQIDREPPVVENVQAQIVGSDTLKVDFEVHGNFSEIYGYLWVGAEIVDTKPQKKSDMKTGKCTLLFKFPASYRGNLKVDFEVTDAAGNRSKKSIKVSHKGKTEKAPEITLHRIYACPGKKGRFCVLITTSGQALSGAELYLYGPASKTYYKRLNLDCPNKRDCEGEFELPDSIPADTKEVQLKVIAENGLMVLKKIPLKDVPIFNSLPKENPLIVNQLLINGQSTGGSKSTVTNPKTHQ